MVQVLLNQDRRPPSIDYLVSYLTAYPKTSYMEWHNKAENTYFKEDWLRQEYDDNSLLVEELREKLLKPELRFKLARDEAA